MRRSPACSVSSSAKVSSGGTISMSPNSTWGNIPCAPAIIPSPASRISSRQSLCPTIVTSGPKKQLPKVWSRWLWVLISVATGLSVVFPIAAMRSRVRCSVVVASKTDTPRPSVMKAMLFSPQPPSSWI